MAGDYYTKFYKFRVAEETVARFSVSTDTGLDGMDYVELDLFGPNCHDLIVADNRDVPLKPGVYFAAVYGVLMDGAAFWEKNTQLSVDIGISHTGKTIGSISFPCTEKFDFAADSPLRYGSWNTLWYKLSLTEDTMVGIDDPTGSYAFSILTPDMRQFAGYAPYDNPKITTVPAGEYYFVLADFMNGGGSGSFALMSPYNYGKIDFSELIKNGETKVGDNGDFAWTVMIADQSARPSVQTAYTRGWCFDAEAGHIYKLTCGMFTKVENDSYGISLFRTPCTGNPAEDGIRGGSYAVAGRSGTGELSYEAEADGRINLMLFTQADAAEDGDRVYGMSMREIEYTDTDEKTARPYVREITLPYVAHIYLSPEYNTFKSGAEYYKLYKLTLGETTELRMLSGFNPVTGFIPSLHVYTGRDMTEELTPSWGLSEGGGGTVLAPGVYYLKISDNNFHEDRTPGSGSDVYADCMVEIAGVTGADIKPVQTLAEMCADAVTVSYAADMPYTDSGSFLAAGSKFLQDPSLFVTAPLYTKVYKVTGMSAYDRIHVMDKSADKSCFVGIYTLEDGNCVLQADNYGDWEASFQLAGRPQGV